MTTIHKLIYLHDGGLHTLEYVWGFVADNIMHCVNTSKRYVIVNEGCYPELKHVYKDGRRKTVGQYPSTTLGREWSEGLQEKYALDLERVRQAAFYENERGHMVGGVTMNSNLEGEK